MPADDMWADRNSGPVVRPYALTGGRTEPTGGEALDLIDMIVSADATGRGDDSMDLSPEDRRILRLCAQPAAVADVASATDLPLGVIRVLLADLISRGRITVVPQRPVGEQAGTDLLKEVLHGLRAL